MTNIGWDILNAGRGMLPRPQGFQMFQCLGISKTLGRDNKSRPACAEVSNRLHGFAKTSFNIARLPDPVWQLGLTAPVPQGEYGSKLILLPVTSEGGDDLNPAFPICPADLSLNIIQS
jgi:hypothetical protein